MTVVATAWEESKHPRHPAGSEAGGEFAPKYGDTPAWATAIDEGRSADDDAQRRVALMHETEQRLNVGQKVPYDLDPAYAEFNAWAETMRKWYTEEQGFPPDYWPTQRDRLWNDYVNSVERGGSAVRARLAQADVPGLSMTPQLNTGNGGDLDALMDPERTHAPDFDVTMDADPLAHPSDRPGFTVWTHEDGSIEVEDILDVGDSTYFPVGPESPTAAAYVRALDAARGQVPTDNSTVTIYRGMSDREMDAWVNGEEIPAGKFFTDRPTTSYAMDVAGEPPVLQTFSVPRSMLIEVAPGEFQLRRRGKMRHGRIEPIVGAAWDESKHPRHPAGSEAGGEFAEKNAEVEAAFRAAQIDDASIVAGVRKALEEMPDRLTHGDTGKHGFWLVDGNVYVHNDWRDIPRDARSRAVSVHSHAPDGVTRPEMIEENFPSSGVGEKNYPFSTGDLKLLQDNAVKGDAAPRIAVLHGDGTMDIVGFGLDTNMKALHRKSVKTLQNEIFGDYATRTAHYDATGEPSTQAARRRLREWLAANKFDYREGVRWGSPDEVRALRMRHSSDSLRAAAWDETKHRRHPAGSPGSTGGEFAPSAFMRGMRKAAESRPSVPPGFPPGVFDPNDSVAFWPDEPAAYSGFSTTREGPFWKAIVDDDTGDEVAFWFADRDGRPHHEDMNAALGRDEFMAQTFVAGYGDEPDLSGYLTDQAETAADFAASDIEALMEAGDSHELYNRFGLLMGDYEGMTHEEIRDELVKEKLAEYRQIPRRHRRDIADAREIIAGREAMRADAGPADPPTLDAFNALVADERDALEAFEPTLTHQYRARLRELGRAAAARFEDLAAPALAAAVPPADWQPPTVEELLAGLALVEPEDTAATRRKAFERVVDGILRRLGLSFDVTAILSQTILNGLAARSDGIIEGMRAIVARIVANAYLNGLSVPQTAAAIVEGVDGIAEWQATQLARNDLVGMANGGSLLAARIVRDAYPTVGLAYKEWLATDDERVRPSHWAAHEQRVPLETPFVVGAATLAYPGDPSGPDEEVINCRCTVIYRAEPAAVTAAWNEADHPRDPGGEGGGEFIEKGSTAPDERAQMPWRETLSKLADYTADDVRAGKVPGVTEGELRHGVAAHARDVAITVAKAENGHGAYLANGRLDTVLIAHEAGHYVANEIQRESDRGMAIPELDPFRTDPGYEILDPKPTAQGRIKVRRKSDGAEMYVFPKPATYENPWGLNPDPGEILADTYSRLLHDDSFSAEALKDEPEFAKPRQALLDRVARTAEKMGLPHKRLYRVTAEGSEAITAAAWDETKHPRHPGGAPLSQGGEFAPVVEATVADATDAAIGRLDDEVRTWPIGEPRRYAREALASIPMRPNPGELIVTARRNGELVAVGSARLHPEPGPMQEPDTLMGDYAGAIRGGGLPLFRAMVEYAADRNLGMFWTAGNDDAARLYDRLGARRQGSNGYYLRPEDVRGLLDDTFRYAREPLAASAFDGLRWPREWWIPGPADMTAAVWREEDHPRDPGGEGGGQWIPKGTTAPDELRGMELVKHVARTRKKEIARREAQRAEATPTDGAGVEDEALAQQAIDEMAAPITELPTPDVAATVNGISATPEMIQRAEDKWLHEPENLDMIAMRNELPSPAAYVDALEEKAKEQLFGAEVTIRTPVELVDEIAADWRFRSQFETQTSRGTLDNDVRGWGEELLFGYPRDLSAEDRPIYGYMQKMTANPNEYDGWVSQYGEVKWELKRDVRKRTTFTQGDSLATTLAPSPVDDPSYLSLVKPRAFTEPSADRDALREPAGIFAKVPYVEAQIHGKVTMDDVAAVILPRYLRDTIENSTRLPSINPQSEQDRRLAAAVAKLRQYGVTVEYE